MAEGPFGLTLRKAVTRVRAPDGSISYEARGAAGFAKAKAAGSEEKGTGEFFVVDTAPDEKVHIVSKGIAIGSQDAAANLAGLEAANVRGIVNCATGIENRFEGKFEYLTIELLDVPETNIREHFDTAHAFLRRIHAERKDATVLIHCNAGISRSATLVLSWLMRMEGLSLSDAMATLKAARSSCRPNDGFMRQLREYEQQLEQERRGLLATSAPSSSTAES